MFLEFHGLLEQPFGVTPDPAYLYPTKTHREALASLSAGINADRGFLALVAEPGMGKTTVLCQLLHEFRDSARTVYLFFTQCDSREFLDYVLYELGVDTSGMSLVAMHAKLNEMLFDEMLAGKRFILIVDEAQDLDESVLETIRLLSNFESQHAKLLQIVLAGQPGLAAKLEKPELSQLRQRIAVWSHLEPLTADETAAYIEHRLKVAGYWGEPLFEADALEVIAKQTRGIPRNINSLCYNALSVAYERGKKTVTAEIVQDAVNVLGFAWVAPQSDIAPNPIPIRLADSDPAAHVASAAPVARVPKIASGFTQPESLLPTGDAARTSASAPAPLLTYNPRSRFHLTHRGLSAFALGGVALLGGGLYWHHSTLQLRAQGQATSVPPVDSSKSLATASANSSPQASTAYAADPQDTDSGQVLTVIAKPQQTLKEISLVYLGRYDRQLFDEICSLNPGLTDPDHIQGGQLIRLPLQPHALTKAIDTSEAGSAAKNDTSKGLFTRFVALMHGK